MLTAVALVEERSLDVRDRDVTARAGGGVERARDGARGRHHPAAPRGGVDGLVVAPGHLALVHDDRRAEALVTKEEVAAGGAVFKK